MTELKPVNTPTAMTVAPLTNVRLCMSALTRIMERDEHLPGIAAMYGPPGYGKSMSATFAANSLRCYYIECRSSWTKKAVLISILREMGIEPAKNIYEMTEQVSEQLMLSQRPLIVDEFDHIVDKKAVEIIRDIYEGSQSPILLLGEERMPAKLERWERFHSRIMEFVPAQPVSMEDAKALVQLYSPGTDFKTDLLKKLVTISRGSVRRLCVNISRIRRFAESEGLDSVDASTWGSRELYTGRAPTRRIVA